MFEQITVQSLFEAHQKTLKMEWLAGCDNRSLVFRREPEELSTLVGYLNFVHPQQIIVIGTQEFTYLAKLDVNSYNDSIQQIFNSKPTLIVIADKQSTSCDFIQLANDKNIPLVSSQKPGQMVIDHLSHYLSTKLASTMTVHGVFMEVFDLGVLLAGDSGVGKSELALELISRGHRLIADDSPTLSRFAPSALTGMCPPLLQDFLEVRGLGVLNVRALYGSTAIKDRKQLHLIVRVVTLTDEHLSSSNRLYGMHRQCEILGVEIPEVSIPVAPGRNLAILVEAAVRDQVLKRSGYDASSVFDKRQRKHMSMTE